METVDSTFRILQNIQGSLAGLRDDVGLLRVEHGEHLDRLESRLSSVEDGIHTLHTNAAYTNTTLGLVAERLMFFERAATAANLGRARLDERVDHVEARLDRVELRLDAREES